MLHDRYPTEDDYFAALADAHDRAAEDARAEAVYAADLHEWDSDAERDTYIEAEFAAEYERLCEEYEKAL